MSLANISLHDLNLTANCSNLALGVNVWINDFYDQNPTPGSSGYDDETTGYYNATTDDGPSSDDSGYSDYPLFWTNGTSPEWLAFWRYSLASALPDSYMNLSDQEITKWSNVTEMFYFFDYYDFQLVTEDGRFPRWLSTDLAYKGGCNPTYKLNTTDSILSMAEACMTQYCCSSATNATISHHPESQFPYFQNWTVQETCSFDTCLRSNNGNPDLSGIGILVAYLIQGGLLALSVIMFGVKMITDSWRSRPDVERKFLDAHDAAVSCSSGVLIDTSVFFSLSVCFAAIIFNFYGSQLLYEVKLGQVSTLMIIDTPIAILLLSYPHQLERKNLRIFIVLLAALMTFIIQFLFKRANRFDPSDNLCLEWNSTVEGFFRARFTVKAVWGSLLLVFIMCKIFPWHIARTSTRRSLDDNPRIQARTRSRFWKRVTNSSVLLQGLLFILVSEAVPKFYFLHSDNAYLFSI